MEHQECFYLAVFVFFSAGGEIVNIEDIRSLVLQKNDKKQARFFKSDKPT